jgi:hypothetical protein
VKDLFLDWLRRELPERESKIINRLREVRKGRLTDSRFGIRMSGEGKMAESIEDLFRLTCRKYHLNKRAVTLSTEHFVRTLGTLTSPRQQLEIF